MLRYVRPVRWSERLIKEYALLQQHTHKQSDKPPTRVTIERKKPVPVNQNLPRAKADLPDLPSLYLLNHERPNPSPDDYDVDGVLKPLPPQEILDMITERFESAGSGTRYHFLDTEIWNQYRRPDTGPERNLSSMEKSRKALLEEAFTSELDTMDQHAPMFRKMANSEIKKLTLFGRDGKIVPPAMQPLPKGYFNYQTNRVETLPEQSFLRLVGFEHLHLALTPTSGDVIDEELLQLTGKSIAIEEYNSRIELLRERIEQNFSKVAKHSTRSELVTQFADDAYMAYVFQLQSGWAQVTNRPVDDIIKIQNMIIDSTDLSHIDINWLFQKNWKLSDSLTFVNLDMVVTTFMALKQETGITFGADLGMVLTNCPEFITLDPKFINDRKNSFIGWGFDGEELGNIIRYTPNAFLNNNYDDIESKIQYLVMRCNAPRDTIAEIGLLDMDIRELSAKYEFIYRRGIIHRPSKRERRLEMKKRAEEITEKHTAEKREIIGDIYMKTEQQFLEYAQCTQSEFDM